MAPGEGDYLMPMPADVSRSAKFSELTHQDASAASLRIFSVLGDPLGRFTSLLLHPRVAEAFWREHSCRSFLPSAASCLNGPAFSDIDLVGKLERSMFALSGTGSSKVQSGVRRNTQNGSESITLDEEESLQDLEGLMLKQGLSQEIASSLLLLLTWPSSVSPFASRCNSDSIQLPVTPTTPPLQICCSDAKKSAYSELSRSAARKAACRPPHKGYHVTFPPRGRTLHCLGGCCRVPTVDYTSFEYRRSQMSTTSVATLAKAKACFHKGWT